jgi:hypothetical protein
MFSQSLSCTPIETTQASNRTRTQGITGKTHETLWPLGGSQRRRSTSPTTLRAGRRLHTCTRTRICICLGRLDFWHHSCVQAPFLLSSRTNSIFHAVRAPHYSLCLYFSETHSIPNEHIDLDSESLRKIDSLIHTCGNTL